MRIKNFTEGTTTTTSLPAITQQVTFSLGTEGQGPKLLAKDLCFLCLPHLLGRAQGDAAPAWTPPLVILRLVLSRKCRWWTMRCPQNHGGALLSPILIPGPANPVCTSRAW